MRQKMESVLSVRWNDEGLPLPVRVYRAKYQAISQVLDHSPEILDRIHDDLRKLSQGGRRGREGDYTSENILRAREIEPAWRWNCRRFCRRCGRWRPRRGGRR